MRSLWGFVIGSVSCLTFWACDSTVSGRMTSSAPITGILSENAAGTGGSAAQQSGGSSTAEAGAGGEGGPDQTGTDDEGDAGDVANAGSSDNGSSAGSGGASGFTQGNPQCDLVEDPCAPITSSEKLPQRPIVSAPASTIEHQRVTVGDIYTQFLSACGRCHGPQRLPDESNGHWVPRADTFATDENTGDIAISRLTSEDLDFVMPPRQRASQRHNASVDSLLEMLQDWVDQGKRAEGYTRDVVLAADGNTYRYSDADRQKFTNIGTCVPNKELVSCSTDGRAEQLDELFARVQSFADLPRRLDQTDIVSFDSAELARYGVVSFAPAYTLFSDHAKKMRYLRVPRGQKIHYNPAKLDFEIPPNTRFYKTFLKPITDEQGNTTFRKIETRIILSRPDKLENGVATPSAIFGSYRWNEDESHAELVVEPYRDGTPFKDQIFEYITDEKTAREKLGPGVDLNSRDGVIAASAVNLGPVPNPKLTRHYGIPGSDRCVQCHMGSTSQSFILGFTPFHVDRRHYGEGGTFDNPAENAVPMPDYGADELSQLQRMIDYEVIDNIKPGDIKLERAQDPYPEAIAAAVAANPPVVADPRKVRTPEELTAQAYMMGNCAFCHNPRGFPTIQNPPLRDKLNFFPREGGGIFGFPLDRTSPRTFRTDSQDVEFPYITPSLFDRNVPGSDNIADKVVGAVPGSATGTSINVYVQAPWRSLIYRNVSTPFTYAHDGALHPHMPLNVPGFDCRVPRIMGEWMVSIPARLDPAAHPQGSGEPTPALDVDSDSAFQPWQEALPGERDYDARKSEAATRLANYKTYAVRELSQSFDSGGATVSGVLSRYGLCPDQSDTVAPEMTRALAPTMQPDSVPIYVAVGKPVLPGPLKSNEGVAWQDDEPDRPHWLDRDLTDPQGESYVPRRSDWKAALSSLDLFLPPACPEVDTGITNCIPDATRTSDPTGVRAIWQPVIDQARRVYALQSALTISPGLRAFATRPLPFGLWAKGRATAPGEEAHCAAALQASPKVRALQDKSDAPLWLNIANPAPDDLVFQPWPGQALFTQICSNCHGVEADSRSLLGNTILEMTGGRTRVANLRDGFFGQGGQRRAQADEGVRFSSDDEAGRYVIWMGLGGTTAVIPRAVLNRVGNTRPLGVKRNVNPIVQPTPNMLSNAVGFCEHALGRRVVFALNGGRGVADYQNIASFSSLVTKNGDAELWLELCAKDNPAPIRVVEAGANKGGDGEIVDAVWGLDAAGNSIVPGDAWMGTARGVERGLQPGNFFAWCYKEPELAADKAVFEKDMQAAKEKLGGKEPPICPPEVLIELGDRPVQSVYTAATKTQLELTETGKRWATRGAMNVGLSVFIYLDAKSKGLVTPLPAFDACALPGSN